MSATSVDVDLYSGGSIEESRETFARIREAGPLVWLPRNKLWAMGRYEDCRAALRDPDRFISGEGVAANGITNRAARSTTLFSDGETHKRRRSVLMRSLGAKAIGSVSERLNPQAESLIEDLIGRDGFDAVGDFASHLPVSVVADLVGVRRDSDQLLRWAAASFDGLGPINARGLRAAPSSIRMLLFSMRMSGRKVDPGSWAASVFEAADRGELSKKEAKTMVIDFIAPSLDTTILASAYMLWLVAKNPEAWDEVRADPELIDSAVVESVRLSAPIRSFTRRVARDTEVAGTELKKGDRVAIVFASANLDETRYPDPEAFDLHRPPGGHLGWGNGPHTCVGLHLAKLEMKALLSAMVPRVSAVNAGEPQPIANNVLQGFTALPAKFEEAA